MDFLKEVEPYKVYISMYLDKGAMPNLKIRQELCDLDLRLRESEKAAIYGKANIEIYPTDLGCAGCIRNMMNNLRRWIKIKEKEQTVEFKGVPQDKIVDLSKMKWGEFKSYCKEQGLSVKGKKRKELEEELNSVR